MTEQNTNEQGGKWRDTSSGGPLGGLLAELPTDRLKSELEGFLDAIIGRGVQAATEKLTGVTENGGAKGEAVAEGARELSEGKSPVRALAGAGLSGLKETVSQAFGGGGGKGGGGGGKKIKVTNIVEEIDVGVPVQVAYNQWTQFRDFPSFMKKVENVDQEEDEKLTWKAQIFWSHRTWTSTIIEQVPDKRIVWRSSGNKGYVDGAVTFHEVAPDLTRILLILEYHPQGLFEHTGNLWRAQGRRARLELKHFRRHVMTNTLLQPDEVEGWRGEIRDGEVVRQPGEEDEGGAEDEAETGAEAEEPEDAYDEEADEEPDEEEEYDDEPLEQEGSAEAEDYEDEPEDDEPEDIEDEYDEPSDEEEPYEPDEEEPEEERMEDEDGRVDEVSERRQRVSAEGR